MKYMETLRRALRTFLQAAVGYVVTNVAIITAGYQEGTLTKAIIVGFVGSAVAAGLAAVMNLPPKDDEEAMG